LGWKLYCQLDRINEDASVPPEFTASVSLNGIKASEITGFTHTHPGNDRFSGGDWKQPALSNKPYYVIGNSGNVYRWDPMGAKKYMGYLDRIQRSSVAARLTLGGAIPEPERWGIKSVCPGGDPCIK
jgi:hypothetical protein